MSHKFLLKMFLTSVGLFGALTTAAVAQGAEPPACYIIDNSGKLTDLTDICDVSQKRSPERDSAARKPLNIDNNPACYIIDNSGKLTDLTDVCHVSQKRSPEVDAVSSEPSNVDNRSVSEPNLPETGLALEDNQYILGNKSLTTESGAISSVYYIDNAIGADYAAYVRRYKNSPTSLTRQTLRENIFQFNTNVSASDRLTSILRDGREVPFIIYRY